MAYLVEWSNLVIAMLKIRVNRNHKPVTEKNKLSWRLKHFWNLAFLEITLTR